MNVGDRVIVKWSMHESASAHRFGEFSSIEQVIRLQADMPSRFKAVDTFFHEVTHAFYWVYGIDDADKEERAVSVLGLHRDNPWLSEWLRKVLS